MATREITETNFNDEVTGDGKTVLLDFWAAWCGPCRMFAPVFEKVSGKYPDIVFGKIDTEAEQALAGTFQITSIPTLMVIRDNVVVFSQPGAIGEAALEDLITQVQALDMSSIKSEMAKEKA